MPVDVAVRCRRRGRERPEYDRPHRRIGGGVGCAKRRPKLRPATSAMCRVLRRRCVWPSTARATSWRRPIPATARAPRGHAQTRTVRPASTPSTASRPGELHRGRPTGNTLTSTDPGRRLRRGRRRTSTDERDQADLVLLDLAVRRGRQQPLRARHDRSGRWRGERDLVGQEPQDRGLFQFLVSVSCVGSLCVVGDDVGRTITSNDPADGASATWTRRPALSARTASRGRRAPRRLDVS